MSQKEKLFSYIKGGYNSVEVSAIVHHALDDKRTAIQMMSLMKDLLLPEIYDEYDNGEFITLYRNTVGECARCQAIGFNATIDECDFCNGVFNGESVDIEVIGTIHDSRIPQSSIDHAKKVFGAIIDNVNQGDRLVLVYISKGVRQILELE